MMKAIILKFFKDTLRMEKEEAEKLFNTFISNYASMDKGADERYVKLDICPSTNAHPNGIGFNVKTADDKLYNEILPEDLPHFKEAQAIGTFAIKVTDPAIATMAEEMFNNFFPMVKDQLPKDVEIVFRAKDKNINIDAILKSSNKDIQEISNLGINFSDYSFLKFKLRNDLKLDELFDAEPMEVIKKACEFQLLFDSRFFKINSILQALIKTISSVDLRAKLNEFLEKIKKGEVKVDPKVVERVEKVVAIDDDPENFEDHPERVDLAGEENAILLNRLYRAEGFRALGEVALLALRGFQNFDTKLTYDPKTPADLIQTDPTCAAALKKVTKKIKKGRMKAMEFIEMGKPMLEGFGASDLIKGIDFDKIIIAGLIPKTKNGLSLKISLPGLTKLIATKIFA